jgi:hypothetical protein
MTVLSTWDDEDISTFEPLIGPNFRILQSKKPEYPGPANINMQIVSTRAGIQALVALGCDRILKTRTDIFLANPQFLNYFSWAKSKGESHSIVFSSFDSFLFRFFSVSDQVMFGSADDLTVFWNLNLVAPNETPPISEVHLFQEYLKRNEFLPEDTFDSYMAALRDYAVIADHEQIGQIWNKGTFTSLGFRWRGSTSPHPMSPLTHWLWDSIRQDASYLRSLLSKLT